MTERVCVYCLCRAQKWAYGLHTPPTSIPTSYFCRARGFQVPPPAPPTSVGHAAWDTELPHPFGPLPSRGARLPPWGSASKPPQ